MKRALQFTVAAAFLLPGFARFNRRSPAVRPMK